MSTTKSKTDFASGENGATPKLTKEQLGLLEEFGRLVRPSRRHHESFEEFEKALALSAEHISNLIEGKTKKVGKSTYKELKTILDGVKASGYLNKNVDVSDATDEATNESSKKEAPEGNTVSKENARKKVSQNGQEQEKREGGRRDKKRGSTRDERASDKGMVDQKANDQNKQRQQYEAKPMAPQNLPDHHAQVLQQQQSDVYHQPVTSQQPTLVTDPSHQPVAMAADSTQSNLSQQYHHAPQVPQQMTVPVTPAAPGINFLQESQIDMGSPQMDPAVVVVHHTAPPTQNNQQVPNIATTVQNQVYKSVFEIIFVSPPDKIGMSWKAFPSCFYHLFFL